MASINNVQLDISIDCEDWTQELPSYQNLIENCFAEISKHVSEGRALSNFPHIEVSVVLCSDDLIHQLNHDYREKDKATNVLSFCGLDEEEINSYLKNNQKPENRPFSLGEIYIAYETMNRESQEATISLINHFQHLIVHGFLHLLGFDHIHDDDAKIMEALETSLLRNLGIDDPYAA